MWSVRFAFVLGAALVAAGLGVGATSSLAPEAAKRARAVAAPYLLAAGGVIALYGVWQFALEVLVVHTAGAIGRGRSLALLEHRLYLPSEASLQRLALHAPWLVKLADRYYADADFPALCAGLAWLFARHRDRFAYYLAALIGLTGVCAVVQAVPVAPPRLVPGFGFVDTGTLFHQIVYSPGANDPGVLTTMPSVHVAWAAWVAIAICGSGAGRWRWLFIAHPVLTLFVVVVTGNHFWADAVVALIIVGVIFVVENVLVGMARRRLWGKGARGARGGSGSGRQGYDAWAHDPVPTS